MLVDRRLRELSLFSGTGGGLLGTKLLGFRAVGYVERDPYCQAVLEARIRDGLLDRAPIFGDIRAFLRDGWADRYRGLVDVVTAGFPCQPFSVAGKRRADADERNLWPETAECIRRVRPRFALLENVPGLAAHSYFGTVLGDLAALGFDAEWLVLGADDAGAPHRRKRLWILAYSDRDQLRDAAGRLGGPSRSGAGEPRDDGAAGDMADSDSRRLESERIGGLLNGERPALGDDVDGCGGAVADSALDGRQSRRASDAAEGPRGRDDHRGGIGANVGDAVNPRLERHAGHGADRDESGRDGAEPRGSVGAASVRWWDHDPADERPESESFVGRVAHGVAHRVDRLRATGNGQSPAVVALAWKELVRRASAD